MCWEWKHLEDLAFIFKSFFFFPPTSDLRFIVEKQLFLFLLFLATLPGRGTGRAQQHADAIGSPVPPARPAEGRAAAATPRENHQVPGWARGRACAETFSLLPEPPIFKINCFITSVIKLCFVRLFLFRCYREKEKNLMGVSRHCLGAQPVGKKDGSISLCAVFCFFIHRSQTPLNS